MSYNLSKIKKFVNQKVPFVSFTCVENYIYIATKKQIFRLNANNLTEKNATAEIPPGSQNILHIYHTTVSSGITLILLQTDNSFYALKEKSFSRDKWTTVNLKNYNKYVHFAALKQDSLVAFVDSQYLYLYSLNVDALTENITSNSIRTIQHRMKDPIDVLATADTILIYDKKSYKIFNSKLEELSCQSISKPFRCVTPIIGYNSYCAIQDNNTLIQLHDDRKLFHHEIKFPEVIISFQVKLPYICAISQKNFFYYLTVTNSNPYTCPLPKDMKTKFPALMCIRDNAKDKTKDKAKVNSNYNIFYASDDTLYSIDYNDDYDHKSLTSSGSWDQLVEMYVLMDHDLESFYKSMADDMLAKNEYEKAFAAFKKSRCNPFEVLGRFQILKARTLKDEAMKDADERIKLLKYLRELADSPIPDREKIQEALDNVNKQSHMKVNLINEHSTEPNQITDQIIETEEVKKEIDELYKSGTKKIDDQSGSSNNLYNALRNYVEGLASNEHHPTRLKIYNTILCEIYAKTGMFLPMQSLVENKNPVFFSMVFSELKNIQANLFILSLCEQYHQHEIAIETAKNTNSYEQLISYVSNSSDCLTLAPGLLKDVFQYYCEDKDKKKDKGKQKMHPSAAAKKAAGLFFSPDLYKTSEDIENVLQIIDSIELKQYPKDPKNYKDDVKEAFLNFVVFTLHSKSPFVNSQLCDLYINKLLNLADPSIRTKYIDISQEKEEMKQPREALLKLLMESDYYEPSEVVQKLPDIYLEEKIAAYLKINTKGSLEKCIDLVVVPNVDIEIAVTKFCDIAYDKDDSDRSDIYNLLFNALNQEYNKNKASPDLKNKYMKRIKYLLNERARFLNPDQVIENIPKDIPIIELKDFFDNSSTPRINRLRQLKLQNALIEETIKQKQTQIQYLKAGKVVVTRGLKCIVCGKSIDESVFYVRNDSTVAHAACNASHDD